MAVDGRSGRTFVPALTISARAQSAIAPAIAPKITPTIRNVSRGDSGTGKSKGEAIPPANTAKKSSGGNAIAPRRVDG
jgi:hypothetical protein